MQRLLHENYVLKVNFLMGPQAQNLIILKTKILFIVVHR
jgi:hypothetical protein